MARHEIQKLQSSREELKRRNLELKAKLMEQPMVLNIGFRVGNPSSGIDSMVEVLKCLKSMDLKTTAIHSQFSPQQFSGLAKIQTQVSLSPLFLPFSIPLLQTQKKLPENGVKGIPNCRDGIIINFPKKYCLYCSFFNNCFHKLFLKITLCFLNKKQKII